jgi:hypothetical protein
MRERNQIMATGATILQVIDWDEIGDPQDIVMAGNRGRLGPALTQWLANKGWLPPCPPLLTIDRLKMVSEIGPEWQVWLGPVDRNGLKGDPDVDPRAGLVTTFDASKVRLLTGLVGDETSVTGEEKLTRLRARPDIRIDAQTLWALYTEKGQVTLRWLHEVHGVTWMEALGTVLRDPRGFRYSLFLYRLADGGWDWHYDWLDNDRRASIPALGLASS